MDEATARKLVEAERGRVKQLLRDVNESGREDREWARQPGDAAAPAQPLTFEEESDAVAESLRQRLAALDRAMERIEEGTYGRSVRSGAPIPDARLEADPAADLTIDEASEAL